MKNVRIYFGIYEGNEEDLPPVYPEVGCHIIFYVNIGENFRYKYRMVAGWHKNTAPFSLTY